MSELVDRLAAIILEWKQAQTSESAFIIGFSGDVAHGRSKLCLAVAQSLQLTHHVATMEFPPQQLPDVDIILVSDLDINKSNSSLHGLVHTSLSAHDVTRIESVWCSRGFAHVTVDSDGELLGLAVTHKKSKSPARVALPAPAFDASDDIGTVDVKTGTVDDKATNMDQLTRIRSSFSDISDVITVSCPELRSKFLSKHYVYKITVDKSYADAPVQTKPIYHRFKDFIWLRDSLLRMLPGFFIPPLPPKRIFGNEDREHVLYRMEHLKRFLNRLNTIEIIRRSHPFTMFLDTDTDVLDDYKEEINTSIHKFNAIEAYQANFTDTIYAYGSKVHNSAEFDRMYSFLVESRHLLEINLNRCSVMLDCFLAFAEETEKLGHGLDALAVHEKLFQVDFSRVYVAPSFRQWLAINVELKDQYTKYFRNVILSEIDDITVFLQCLDTRSEIAKQHKKSLSRVDKWQSRAVENDKHRIEKESDIETEHKLRILEQSISAILALREFPRLLQDRAINYNDSIHLLSLGQIGSLEMATCMWKYVTELTQSNE